MKKKRKNAEDFRGIAENRQPTMYRGGHSAADVNASNWHNIQHCSVALFN